MSWGEKVVDEPDYPYINKKRSGFKVKYKKKLT